jgi:hypothetical protein
VHRIAIDAIDVPPHDDRLSFCIAAHCQME